MTGSTIFNNLGMTWALRYFNLRSVNQLITKVFVEQPMASPGSAKYFF